MRFIPMSYLCDLRLFLCDSVVKRQDPVKNPPGNRTGFFFPDSGPHFPLLFASIGVHSRFVLSRIAGTLEMAGR